MANTTRSRRRTTLALFPTSELEPRPRRGGGWLGWILLFAAVIGIAVVASAPAPYVIEQPGPVYDTLGDVTIEGESVPMIQVPMQETYPTEGALDLLTVTISGNRDALPTWFDVGLAAIDPSREIVPVDDIYPPGTTVEDSTNQGKVDMANSKKEAIAAALHELGYEFTSTLSVSEILAGGPSEGVLEVGDEIVSVNGESFPDVSGLRAAIAANGVSKPADIVIRRDGVERTVRINPEYSDAEKPTPIIGIVVASAYDFPFEVSIQLDNVGGPSAGMMFALGIIDKLTEGSLNAGERVAGTGTISGTGDVGPIGGIRQKMWGAQRAGATYFLAPVENCDEVVGHVPPGLTVFSVDDLDDALVALSAIRSTGTGAGLPTCDAAAR